MQRVRAIVLGNVIRASVQHKFAIRDSIRVAPHRRPDVGLILLVPVEIVVAENHIRNFAAAIRCFHRHQRRAVVGHHHFEILFVAEHVALDRRSVFGLAELGHLQRAFFIFRT